MTPLPFAIRGVVEGFYGAFYTAPERNQMIRFLGAQGYNYYLYGPKNDRQHRARWREDYSPKAMRQFAETIRLADVHGVSFAYALSPGVSICYSSDDELATILRKFRAFYDLGVRAFSLFLDDIASEFTHDADRAHYPTYAAAHVDLCNRVYAAVQQWDSACTLSMCPTDYHGTAPFSDYLHALGAGLHPAIDVFYTGPAIYSPHLSAGDASAFAQAVRRPPIIWDNYPVNDLALRPDVFLAPVTGRDTSLVGVVKGFAVNPMLQAEASKVALYTYGRYFCEPQEYNCVYAQTDAFREIAGEESAAALKILADNLLDPVTHNPTSPHLQTLVEQALQALQSSTSSHNSVAIDALLAYLAEIDEAGYHLKFQMDNLALRNDLLPWIEQLESWVWAARYAIWTLQKRDQNDAFLHQAAMMTESFETARTHHKRSGGSVIQPLVEWITEQLSTHAVAKDSAHG